jgi:hypothetical protein
MIASKKERQADQGSQGNLPIAVLVSHHINLHAQRGELFVAQLEPGQFALGFKAIAEKRSGQLAIQACSAIFRKATRTSSSGFRNTQLT